ncbi:DNA-binding protein [Desulforhopalus vacuolatus]|uniref:DNA-binding protein n=1 Tax=Desulforhopalus vacuolatus TaxID=40414 RepID=UPI0019655A77|nr:DNA-binding protein [Desulforhopalus vacuolatus]MBM9520885.1 DNA-binding protein [Desulforhopalus vacuolatus]
MKKRTFFCAAALFALSLQPLNALAMPDAGNAGGSNAVVTGTVLETMNSGGYTYMNVAEKDGRTEWVAIPESVVEKGSEVKFHEGMVMKNFKSNTLNRTFDEVIFSAGIVSDAATSPQGTFHKSAEATKAPAAASSFEAAVEAENKAPAPATTPVVMTATTSGGSVAAIVPFERLSVQKATGSNASTVGDIFTNAAKLDGKDVVVRGIVRKVSPQIMGRNWVHIQDGTGDVMKNHHDLVVTTADTVTTGMEVVVEGVLAADKDFGAGYRYDAIVENASVTPVE